MSQRRAAAEHAAAEFHDKMRKEQYSGKSEWHATLTDGFAELRDRPKYGNQVGWHGRIRKDNSKAAKQTPRAGP